MPFCCFICTHTYTHVLGSKLVHCFQKRNLKFIDITLEYTPSYFLIQKKSTLKDILNKLLCTIFTIFIHFFKGAAIQNYYSLSILNFVRLKLGTSARCNIIFVAMQYKQYHHNVIKFSIRQTFYITSVILLYFFIIISVLLAFKDGNSIQNIPV